MSRVEKIKSQKSVTIFQRATSKEEEERILKHEAAMKVKKNDIRAEYEKHKKELFSEADDGSKANEVRLRAYLDGLISMNLKKKSDLEQLNETIRRARWQTEDADIFSSSLYRSKFISKLEDSYLPPGFHPARTTTGGGEFRSAVEADNLAEKIEQLKDTLLNIQLLDEQEEEAANGVSDKLKEFEKNNKILKRRVNDMEYTVHHAEKRFGELRNIEYVAQTRCAMTLSNVNESKKTLANVHNKESEYKTAQRDQKARTKKYTTDMHDELSKVMISLEEDRVALKKYELQLAKLELESEQMADKKELTKDVVSYIEVLETIEKFILDMKNGSINEPSLVLNANQNNGLIRSESQKSKGTSRGSPTVKREKSRRESPSPTKLEQTERIVKKDSKYFLNQINSFYENHIAGPTELTDLVIKMHSELKIKENSLRNKFEDIQNQKVAKARNLDVLLRNSVHLDGLIKEQAESEKPRMGNNGEMFALNSGIFSQGLEITTISQAKDILEVKKVSDEKFNALVSDIRAFIIRIYCTIKENAYRFGTLMNSANEKGDTFVPEEIARITEELLAQIDDGQSNKKLGRESVGALTPKDTPKEDKSFLSEKFENVSSSRILNLDEVKRMFLMVFPGFHGKADSFIKILRKSALICLFLTENDIESYLVQFNMSSIVEENVKEAIRQSNELEEMAIKNMTQKMEKIIGLYLDLCLLLQKANENGLQLNTNKKQKAKYRLPKITRKITTSESNRETNGNGSKLKIMTEPNVSCLKRKINEESLSYDKTKMAESMLNLRDQNAEEKLDAEDLRIKLDEITSRIVPQKERVSTNSKDKFGRLQTAATTAPAKHITASERAKTAHRITEEEYFEKERQRIKNFDPENLKEVHDDNTNKQNYMSAIRGNAKTLVQEELKKMIKHSKIMSKINILEKQKSMSSMKNNQVVDFNMDNHIPNKPIKMSRLIEMSSGIKLKSVTPLATRDQIGFHSAQRVQTERPESEGSTAAFFPSSSRSHLSLNTFSKFKPKQLLPDVESGKQIKKLNLDLKFTRTTVGEGMNRIKGKTKSFIRPQQVDQKQSERHFTEPIQDRNDYGVTKDILFQNGVKIRKKKLKRTKSEEKGRKDPSKPIVSFDTMNGFLSLNQDPLLANVLVPSLTTGSLCNPLIFENFAYKFDAFKVNNIPPILIQKHV